MLNIRKATTDDVQKIQSMIDRIMTDEFRDESGAYNYGDLEDLDRHYGGNREIFLVGEIGGNIIGTVAIKEDGKDTALLRRIFVHPEFRGKGYGLKLLNRAMEFCFEHKYKSVSFRGTNRMQRAMHLCLQSGFRKEHESDTGTFNLVVLSRNLQQKE